MTNSTIDRIRRNIKMYREKLNLTQEQLSFKASVSQDYLSEIERGKKVPSLKRLIMIAEALNVKLSELVD